MVETVNQSPEPTAADRAVTRALQNLDSSQKYLLPAGVTNEQIKAARAFAEGEIRAEYKELERQDPLSRIISALRESAQTEDELSLVECNIRDLEFIRPRLIECTRDPHNLPSFFRFDDRRTELGWVQYAVIEALKGPSPELSERFLRAIGALEEYPTLKDLLGTVFPTYNPILHKGLTPPGPIIRRTGEESSKLFSRMQVCITQLPTFIAGVEARMNIINYQVGFSISPEALPKIQPSI